MKVKELIEKLKEFDGELKVKTEDALYGIFKDIRSVDFCENELGENVSNTRFCILIK